MSELILASEGPAEVVALIERATSALAEALAPNITARVVRPADYDEIVGLLA